MSGQVTPGSAASYKGQGGPGTGAKLGSWTGTAPEAACGSGEGDWISVPFNAAGIAAAGSSDGKGLGLAVEAPASDERGWKEFAGLPGADGTGPTAPAPGASPTASASPFPSASSSAGAPPGGASSAGASSPAVFPTVPVAPPSPSVPPSASPSASAVAASLDSYVHSAAVGGSAGGSLAPFVELTLAADPPPSASAAYPPQNYDEATLTPELLATGSMPSGAPGPLLYFFAVFSSSGARVAASPAAGQSSSEWTVPPGALSWNSQYYWDVTVSDGEASSAGGSVSWFSTPVPQPLITSSLSQQSSGPGFDPASGDWTTSATDAQVATDGPALEITRDYNSEDPRTSGAFGAGWSSVLDMKVTPGQPDTAGTTQTQVVTYPDGEEVGYGLNSDGSYAPPPGRYAELRSVSGGFTLTDKNDTLYTFTQQLTGGVYGITSIADAAGRTETFTWNGTGQVTQVTSASGRSLDLGWGWEGDADYPHVTSVTTDPAVGGDPSSALTWTYTYDNDTLAGACAPGSNGKCTSYASQAGSDYPDAVMDSGPKSYWRLDDPAGTAHPASMALINEGTDVPAQSGVTFGQDAGPTAGGSVTAASFDGSSSYVFLQGSPVYQASYQSASVWFKTTTAGGVLLGMSANGIAATTSAAFNPVLYIGSDGKLEGEFYNGSAAPMSSPSAVTDGNWHNAVIAGSATGQRLYLDGQLVGTPLASGLSNRTMTHVYVGAGYLGSSWPDEPHQGQSGGYASYFQGDVADVAVWDRQLTPTDVTALYGAGTGTAQLLTKVTRPSGSVAAQVAYDPGTGRATSVTDSNGGTWGIPAPTVKGSSQVYVASVLGAKPQDYYRLAEAGTSDAKDEVNGGTATYNDVTQGVTSGALFADEPVDSFDGSSSYLALPQGLTYAEGTESVGLWFKTTTAGGTLFSSSADPIAPTTSGDYSGGLYIGSDGKLVGAFFDGNAADVVESPGAVDDGSWHFAVLAADPTGQALYLDGTRVGTLSAGLASGTQNYEYIGAGFLGGGWPDEPHSGSGNTGYASWFTGDIAEVAWYHGFVTPQEVSEQYSASKYSTGLTPVQGDAVTDPGSNALGYAYDLLNGDRIVSRTDAYQHTTQFGYDANGFQDRVVNPLGDITDYGFDARGNRIAEQTCQDQANGLCSTSRWTYYPAGNTTAQLTPDPRNDQPLTYSDGRMTSPGDTTYQTKYQYDTDGDQTGVTTPPVAGYPSGRTTSTAYTSGTSTGGYQGAVPPKGLPYQQTTPGGAVTTTLYYADGDVAQVTTPDQQRTVYTYDGLGRKVSQTVYSDTYPDGLTTTYTYDAAGRPAVETGPAVLNRVTGATHTAQATTSYDPDGNITAQTVADLTGEDSSRTVSRTYNGDDQLESQTDAANAKTSYTYDAYGNKASQTDPDGNVTSYDYDANGHLTATTLKGYTGSPPGSQPPSDLTVETREYDPAGRLAYVTDAAPGTQDGAAQQRVTAYNYLDNGLVSQVTAAPSDWSTSFTVDAYSYDGAGNLTEQWTNNWTTDTTYQVDAAGRVTQQVTDPSGLDRTTSISYTPDDQKASVTDSGPDGVSQAASYTYDPAGNVLSRSVTDPGSGGPVAWFNLQQPSGTAVPDSIAGGQGATATDVTWDSDEEANFTGTAGSQISTAGPLVDTTGSFTVTAWAYMTSDGSTQAVASQAAGTNSGFTLGYDAGTGNWEFTRPLADTTGAASAVAGSGQAAAAAAGEWAFLAGTYDANTGTMTLYVNGTAAGTATDTTPIAADGAFTIASAKSGGSQGGWFGGQIDDVQVYPRVMTAGEVSDLFGPDDGSDITTSALVTTWTRDQRGLPVTMTNPDGQVTKYDYDQAGRLAVTTMPQVAAEKYGSPVAAANPVTSTGYDTFGDATESSDPDGVVTTYGFDGDGRQVTMTLPGYTPPDGSPVIAAATDITAYDGDGLVTSVTDAAGNQTKYGYDQLGDRVLVTAPDASTTATIYDDNREPVQVTGPTGAVTETAYDYLGRKTASTQEERDTGDGTADYTTGYTYNDDTGGGWLSHQASPDGVTKDIAYNAAGQVTAVADGQGDTTSYQYDSLGRQTETDYPGGSYTTTGYDPLGDVTSTKQYDTNDNLLASTAAAFDGEGQQLSATDADGNSTTFTRNQAGLVTGEVQPVTATTGISISFGYDAAGKQTRYTDGDGGSWYGTYNSWGLQESRVEPATSHYTSPADSTFTTSYDADGRPVTVAEPGGATVTDSYNDLSELTGQGGAGADAATPDRTFTYDLAGDLQSASASAAGGSGATSESFTYDDRGQVMTASGSAGAATYTYNGDGQVASVADAAGATSYTYDNVGRLATLADPATGVTATYSYNPDSQVSGVSYGGGNDTRSFAYDGQRRLASDTLKTSSGTVVASQSYGYDPDGHLTSETTAGLAGPANNTYTYDQAGRLASWDNGTATTAYGYDGNGNLTTDGAKTLTYDPRNELTSDGTGSYTYTARGTPSSEPGPAGTLTVSFDAYGDQATAGTSSYTYDALGRLTTVTPATGTGQQLSYVGDTGAIASDGTTAYTWDPTGTSLFAAGNPGGGSGKLVLANTHGDVTGQFAPADTTITASRAYDPWGTVIAGTLTGQLGYQSALTDPATGKDLMGARWYNPAAGDFTSADTVPQPSLPDPAAGNPFAYAAGNPLGVTDPTGHYIVPAGTPETNSSYLDQLTYGVTYTGTVEKAGPVKAKKAAAKAVATRHALIKAGNAQQAAKDVTAKKAAAEQAERNALQPADGSNPAASPSLAPMGGCASMSEMARLGPCDGRMNMVKDPPLTGSTRDFWFGAGSFPFSIMDLGCLGVPGGPLACYAMYKNGLLPSQLYGSFVHRYFGADPASDKYILGNLLAGFVVGAAGEIADLGSLADLGAEDATAGDVSAARRVAAFCGGKSFTAGTKVLLASGAAVPIASLEPGDKVLATSTKTGKNQPEAVTAVLVHHDTDLYDLTVKTGHGTGVIHTTSNHLFWDPYHHYWVPANKISNGEHLLAANGTVATADGGTTPKVHDGWMWDLTVPGNNDHDFYVIADSAAVLVHNNSCGPTGEILQGPVPRNASDILDYVDQNGTAPPGYGLPKWQGKLRPFGNKEGYLPAVGGQGNPIKYTEFDVNPFTPGVDRGGERLITGSDGSAYYTNDHYENFYKMR